MGKPLFSQNRLAIQTFGRKRVCRGMGKPLFPQNRLAIQTFGREKVCRGKKNSSIGENLFATGQWGRMRVGGQLRFHGCDFLLSLRPFFEKLRSVV